MKQQCDHVLNFHLYQSVHPHHHHPHHHVGGSGDLVGLHSHFSSYGLPVVGHSGLHHHHGYSLGPQHGLVSSSSHFGGHHEGYHQFEDYGVPPRSKLYGGYVGGFGGYAKGALESIQHLNQGGLRVSD